ncbi:MAG TPA: DUF2878 family protein, partial [Xanthomonadales bacterium]|nr:DUF2878 family protein [Xanthomonadales bacterium]
MHRIGNHLVLFNLGWVASIIFMAKGMPGMALGCMTLVLASHLAVIAAPLKEVVFLACVAVFGTVIASAILASGLVGFTTVLADPGTVITWMIGLWMLFAANINTGLNQIKRSWWTAAIGGTVLGGLT